MTKNNAVRLVHVKPPFLGNDAETVVVGLDRYGFDGQEEEIWVEVGGSNGVQVSSIPFRIYGLSLFDVIMLNRNSETIEVLERSGRGVFRVLVDQSVGIEERVEAASRLSEFFIGMELAHEWNGKGFVAVDIPSSKEALEVEGSIRQWKYVFWEWGAVCNVQ